MVVDLWEMKDNVEEAAVDTATIYLSPMPLANGSSVHLGYNSRPLGLALATG